LLGEEFFRIGFRFYNSFFEESPLPHLRIFPRITLCEIFIREVGTIHPYVIQCVLRINIFNEVIFIIIWHWLLMNIIITAMDFLYCSIITLFVCNRCYRKEIILLYLDKIHSSTVENIYYSQNYNLNSLISLKPKDISNLNRKNKQDKLSTENIEIFILMDDEDEKKLFDKFCNINFTNDSLFVLKLIEKNASPSIVSELVEYFWSLYKYANNIYTTGDNKFLFLKKKVKSFKLLNYNLIEKKMKQSHHQE
jgi:hypothetical protein